MLRAILTNSLLISALKAVGALSFIAVGVLISRAYGAATFGLFSLFVSFLGIVTIFSKAGLDFYVVRKIPEYEDDPATAGAFLRKAFLICLGTSLVIALALMVARQPIAASALANGSHAAYFSLFAVTLILYSLYLVYVEVYRGYGSIMVYTLFRNVLVPVLLLILLGLSVLSQSKSADPVNLYFLVLITLSLAGAGSLLRFLANRGVRLFTARRYAKSIVKYSLPMTVISSTLFVMGYIDSFMINYFLGLDEVGYYSAVVKLSAMVTFVTASVATYVARGIAKLHVSDPAQVAGLFRQTAKSVFLIAVPAYLALVVFARPLLQLYGQEFEGVSQVLYLYGFAGLVTAVPFGYFLVMTDRQHQFQYILLSACAVNILLNLWWIPRIGVLGAALATLMSNLIWNGASFVLLKRAGAA